MLLNRCTEALMRLPRGTGLMALKQLDELCGELMSQTQKERSQNRIESRSRLIFSLGIENDVFLFSDWSFFLLII